MLYADLVGAASSEPHGIDIDEDSTAWLLYTSGTTGFPKGAMLTHRNLVVAALNSVIEYEPQPDERNLVAFPLCHVSGYTVPVTHFRGGRIVLNPMFEPELWMQMVDKHQITGTAMAPTMLNFILQHPKIDEYDLGSLNGIGYGAAAMPVEILRAAIKRFGPIVYSGFGMTELGGNVLTFPKHAHARAIQGEEHLLASCGTPMVLADVKVVDEDMNECPPGVVGEMVIRGEQVLKGYFRNEEGTSKAFEGGWFHTGDMARRDEEGFFYIVDRMKDMIISGGENVYSREVEEVLYLHPSVSESAVVGIPDEKWGELVTADHRAEGRSNGDRAGDHRDLARQPRRLQDAASRAVPRRAPQDRQRQDHQTRTPRPTRRRGHVMSVDLTTPFRLDGKVAIVTGASYGLGVLFAEILATAGADVVDHRSFRRQVGGDHGDGRRPRTEVPGGGGRRHGLRGLRAGRRVDDRRRSAGSTCS